MSTYTYNFLPPYRYMTGDELNELIKSEKKPNEDYLVIDVRDDDFRGGNIKGCINSPSDTFQDDLDDLIEKTKHVNTVVFHCALSQARGPKAARIYSEARKALPVEGEEGSSHQVYVLQGGFTEFQRKYKGDPDLVENWDRKLWQYYI